MQKVRNMDDVKDSQSPLDSPELKKLNIYL